MPLTAQEVDMEKNDEVVLLNELEPEEPQFHQPSPNEIRLRDFVLNHTDSWRDYRDQNYLDEWERYERIFRGRWSEAEKQRQSERSKIISPATQQAVETRHAELMEAVFGQGEFFDIKDDLGDQQPLDVERLKQQLMEDFAQDKLRKSIDQIALMGEIYGLGVGELVVEQKQTYKPAEQPIAPNQVAYGVSEGTRIAVKLVPVNPKNFLWDPNADCIDECMGVAIEKYTSIHKVVGDIAAGTYLNVDIDSINSEEKLEPSQEKKQFDEDKVLLLTYYGLVPRKFIDLEEYEDESFDTDDYGDMVEAIVVIGNKGTLLKAVENPYTMKDRPVLAYQADTVPGRLPGRGAVEKALNMQLSIDGSMRSHMDSLALTNAPMMAMDATRLPRGAKFEVKPGKALMTNGNPNEILFPFKFGTNDGQALTTAKEFERMLLMATATIDSQGMVSQVSRDAGGIDMATATMIKKYKRTLVNFQEDFLIPFIYKATWRFMQFAPERYPSVDVKFIPTATLGIVAREYEQKQLAFLIQTLGANSPLTPILMQSIVKNSSLSNREEMMVQLQKASQPDPQQQQMQQMGVQLEAQLKQAEAQLKQSQAVKAQAEAQKAQVEAQLAPDEMKAKIIAAVSNNLDEQAEGADFERRMRIADLLLKEKDIDSNERIAKMQVDAKLKEKQQSSDYVEAASRALQ
jgi:hypothetical protein